MQLNALLPAAAAALVLALAPATTHAQDTTRTTRDSAKVAPPARPTPQTSNGDVAAPPNIPAITAAIAAPAAVVERIKNAPVGAAVNVRLVDVTPLAAGENEKAFAEAYERGKADLPKLQAAIASNLGISAALKASDATVVATDVVAAEVGQDGALTLYYRKS